MPSFIEIIQAGIKLSSYNFVTSSTHFPRSLSEHKSAINPRFLGIKNHQPRFIAAECSCSWPLNQNKNSKEKMSNLHVQVTQSTSRERSRNGMSWRTRRLVSGLVGSCSSLNKNRRTTRSSPSKSLLYVAWLAPHLPWQGASDRERHRWSDSHPLKVVTADDVLVESSNCSMQVPLNSNSDPSAWDWRLLARLAVQGEPPRINLLKAFPIRARHILQLNVDALPGNL